MNTLTKALNYIWLHGWKYQAMERLHRRTVAGMHGRTTPVNVVFMALDLPLWHYQRIYELMVADERFHPTIVLSPCISRDRSVQEQDMEGLRRFFDKHGISYVDYDFSQPPFDIRGELNPDIMFYTQPYEYLLCREHDCRRQYDCLLCYIPYALWTGTGKLSYDLHFHNMAWRLYYTTDIHLHDAERMATNHGRNVKVVGYPNADDYLQGDFNDGVWKTMPDGRQRKRLIWAPHHTIKSKSVFPARSNFLWMADLMVELAHEYADRLQIAFKPHPALISKLYDQEGWGKERADQYYELWDRMENTQQETGDFADLFMTSDAMIHDCGSFTAEYHYTKNPVMFVSKNTQPIYTEQNDFGKKAFDMQYIGADEADIRHFIDDIVLGGNDPMRPQREQFFRDYLLPPGGKSVAQNVIDDIVESLELKV